MGESLLPRMLVLDFYRCKVIRAIKTWFARKPAEFMEKRAELPLFARISYSQDEFVMGAGRQCFMEGTVGRESPLFFKIFLQMCSEMLHPGEMLIPANHMEEIGLIQSIHFDNDFTDVVNSM